MSHLAVKKPRTLKLAPSIKFPIAMVMTVHHISKVRNFCVLIIQLTIFSVHFIVTESRSYSQGPFSGHASTRPVSFFATKITNIANLPIAVRTHPKALHSRAKARPAVIFRMEFSSQQLGSIRILVFVSLEFAYQRQLSIGVIVFYKSIRFTG
jgi:hypothetical protein